ncbi:LysR family transcriptional regulator [Streptomyces johnsoniae]|uniref:LysR family transcriptional regulator n=1 Tax=Streptomyces johnsoniae TaxID=3075532 RepID=A0ABU2S013_9ACTN|nr:LysR family transcriptional regulator [Streptomyces sp. DSM 41886]MDT0442358.1 LysR family transcriptional regulator [Streptomyces sp. DSM 41886]
MIDLRRLQVLRAVHQHGTVTAAAAALHLTPSAVSHQLRELAKELKVPLVEPQGRRIRLTTAAHLVIEHGDALLARWQEAETALEAHRAGEAGLLRMCGYPSAVIGLIAPATALLRERRPALTVEVTECEAPAGFDMLMSTDADIAVLAPPEGFPHPGDSRFDQESLLAEPFDLIVPAGHPLAVRERVHLAETATESWVLPVPDSCDHYRRTMIFCSQTGFTPRIAHWAKEWAAISALVCHGLGVSLYPRLTHIPPPHSVVRVPVTADIPLCRRILTCVRGGSRSHPLIRQGLAALVETVTSHGLTPTGPPTLAPIPT